MVSPAGRDVVGAADARAFWDEVHSRPGHTDVWSPPADPGRVTPAEEQALWEAGVRASLAQLVPYLGPAMHPGARLLDLGCGPGRVAVPLAKLCPSTQVVGVDLSVVAVQQAAEHAQVAGVANTTFVVGTGARLPDVRPLAGAYSMLTFQHLDDRTVASYLHDLALALDGGPLRLQWTGPDALGTGGGSGYLWERTPAELLALAPQESSWQGPPRRDDEYPTWWWGTMRLAVPY